VRTAMVEVEYPDGAAGAENAAKFWDRRANDFRWQMVKDERGNDAVEARVLEGQVVGEALTPLDGCAGAFGFLARAGECFRVGVEADYLGFRALLSNHQGECSRAAAEVEAQDRLAEWEGEVGRLDAAYTALAAAYEAELQLDATTTTTTVAATTTTAPSTTTTAAPATTTTTVTTGTTTTTVVAGTTTTTVPTGTTTTTSPPPTRASRCSRRLARS